MIALKILALLLLGFYGVVLVAVLGFPQQIQTLRRRFEPSFAVLAQRRMLAIAFVGILAMVLNAATTLRHGIPAPIIHDENSYALAADTFLHGRLTNPTHFFWQHFESIHIIQHPTYASKYPPGQGLMLALGKWIGGEYIVGVWLTTGFAAASMCWMLQGYFTPKWALLGGVIAAFHTGIQMWGSNLWGGNLAVAGGAIVLGATLRLLHDPACKAGVMFGIGAGILLFTRMYEGSIFTLLLTLWLIFRLRTTPATLVRSVVLALSALMPFVVFLGVYNIAVTGSLMQMPYTVHEAQYGFAPLFVFQKLKPKPVYRHALIEKYHTVTSFNDWAEQQSVKGYLRVRINKVREMTMWLFGSPILFLALFGIPAAVRASPDLKWLCVILAVVCGASALATWFHIHYAAPVLGLMFVLFIAGLQRITHWRTRDNPIGINLVCVAFVLNLPISLSGISYLMLPPVTPSAKGSLAEGLLQQGGQHLVFVRYGTGHSPHYEWVYNAAEIDAAQIVWAREIDAISDKRLRDYYPQRKVWLALPDTNPASLVPYSSP